MARKTTEKKKASTPRRALKKSTARAAMGRVKRDPKADKAIEKKLKKINAGLAAFAKKIEKMRIKKK